MHCCYSALCCGVVRIWAAVGLGVACWDKYLDFIHSHIRPSSLSPLLADYLLLAFKERLEVAASPALTGHTSSWTRSCLQQPHFNCSSNYWLNDETWGNCNGHMDSDSGHQTLPRQFSGFNHSTTIINQSVFQVIFEVVNVLKCQSTNSSFSSFFSFFFFLFPVSCATEIWRMALCKHKTSWSELIKRWLIEGLTGFFGSIMPFFVLKLIENGQFYCKFCQRCILWLLSMVLLIYSFFHSKHFIKQSN